MITLPISDLLLLPGVTFFFKKDVFPSGEITAESVGEDILFVMEKEEKEQMTPDDFYPIGVIGTIDSVDEEGNVVYDYTGTDDVAFSDGEKLRKLLAQSEQGKYIETSCSELALIIKDVYERTQGSSSKTYSYSN